MILTYWHNPIHLSCNLLLIYKPKGPKPTRWNWFNSKPIPLALWDWGFESFSFTQKTKIKIKNKKPNSCNIVILQKYIYINQNPQSTSRIQYKRTSYPHVLRHNCLNNFFLLEIQIHFGDVFCLENY